MGRTRLALLEGAQRAVEKYGVRRTSMGEIATVAGIAKGTLYNHFRTKDDVWAALVEHEVTALADECVLVAQSEGVAAALERAADRISAHSGLRRIAGEEPLVLARLVVVGEGAGWDAARLAVGDVLGREPDDTAVATVLRWVVSFVGAPGRSGEAAAGAALLAASLTAAPAAEDVERTTA